MTWCGPYKTGWAGPCKLDVALAFCFLLIALLCSAFQIRKLRLLRGRYQNANVRAGWVTWVYLLCGLLHVAWFLVSCISKQAAGFQVLTQAVFLAAWSAVTVISPCLACLTYPIPVHCATNSAFCATTF